jgi:hypothetical protein
MLSLSVALLLFGWLIVDKVKRNYGAYKLRQFTCKMCGHVVVVNPNLPDAYRPNICVQCWESKR